MKTMTTGNSDDDVIKNKNSYHSEMISPYWFKHNKCRKDSIWALIHMSKLLKKIKKICFLIINKDYWF